MARKCPVDYDKYLLFHRQVFLCGVAAQKVFRLENMTTKEKNTYSES